MLRKITEVVREEYICDLLKQSFPKEECILFIEHHYTYVVSKKAFNQLSTDFQEDAKSLAFVFCNRKFDNCCIHKGYFVYMERPWQIVSYNEDITMEQIYDKIKSTIAGIGAAPTKYKVFFNGKYDRTLEVRSVLKINLVDSASPASHTLGQIQNELLDS